MHQLQAARCWIASSCAAQRHMHVSGPRVSGMMAGPTAVDADTTHLAREAAHHHRNVHALARRLGVGEGLHVCRGRAGGKAGRAGMGAQWHVYCAGEGPHACQRGQPAGNERTLGLRSNRIKVPPANAASGRRVPQGRSRSAC